MPELQNPERGGTAKDAQRLYAGEGQIAKARLVASDYKNAALEIIDRAPFSLRAKLALANIVHMAFDQNVILARNDNLELRKLRLKLAMNYARLSMTKPDVLHPMLPLLEETIYQHFCDYVSASIGGGERKDQHRSIFRMEDDRQQPVGIPQVNPIPPQQQQPSRGIRLPFMPR